MSTGRCTIQYVICFQWCFVFGGVWWSACLTTLLKLSECVSAAIKQETNTPSIDLDIISQREHKQLTTHHCPWTLQTPSSCVLIEDLSAAQIRILSDKIAHAGQEIRSVQTVLHVYGCDKLGKKRGMSWQRSIRQKRCEVNLASGRGASRCRIASAAERTTVTVTDWQVVVSCHNQQRNSWGEKVLWGQIKRVKTDKENMDIKH